ncbi:MAG: hypothetical protein HY744_18800 [Deltaproteobacteria bacterium]|nr:hypothetical protein [Deltaproteobacteria bacterium]
MTILVTHPPLPDDLVVTIEARGHSETYVVSGIGEMVAEGDNDYVVGGCRTVVPEDGGAKDSDRVVCTWAGPDWGPDATTTGTLDADASDFSPAHLELVARWTETEEFCGKPDCEPDHREVALEPL